MKTPNFWRKGGFWSDVLFVFSLVYLIYIRIIRWKQSDGSEPFHADVPVVCIGNIVAGGSGKTPVALAIAQYFISIGLRPAFLSRGYGGKISKKANAPVLVDPTAHTADEVGDEPLLLSLTAPCWIGSDRIASAIAATENGADIIIMDDGLQNPSLYKDLTFAVFDGAFGAGNERLIPAGPLRDDLRTAMQDAHAVIVLGEDKRKIAARLSHTHPILTAELQPHNMPEDTENSNQYIAFAGIGLPEKFFTMLTEKMELNVLQEIPFADHHPYSAQDEAKLLTLAQKKQATLLTTTKDFVRLSPEMQKDVAVIPVDVMWHDPTALALLIKDYLTDFPIEPASGK